jgi:ATP dependent DNA ligase domain
VFIAFDLLYLNGKDLRMLPLIERKAALKKLLRRKRSRILYLDHVESDGRLLFEQIIAMDLEGIVAKRKDSPYKVTEKALAVLDQSQEFAVQPAGRARGVVRAGLGKQNGGHSARRNFTLLCC